jgi:NitT/TauT family transport system permease protein
MRTALGAAWSTLVAAELIAAQEGLGHRMQLAQVYYDLATIFAAAALAAGTLAFLFSATASFLRASSKEARR